MSEVQQLRDMLKRQLTPADEGMIADQEEEMCSLKEENKRDMQPLLGMKEEIFPGHQEWNLSVDQEDIKEEEKLWISQQGEQLQQLEEADLTKFGFTAVTVKSENDDEKPESSQLHQSRGEESTEAEPVASSSSVHRTLTAGADGEDDGGPQPASNSGPNSHLQPGTSGSSSDSSGTETDDSSDWKQTRELQSHFDCQKNTNIVSSSNIAEKQFNCSKYVKASDHMNKSEQHKGRQASGKPFSCSDRHKRQKRKGSLKEYVRIQTGKKPFDCSECGQRFGQKSHLKRHMIIHTGQKQFGCSECGRRFGQKSTLNTHMIIHTRQKQFGCSECGQTFGRKSYLNAHMIIHTGQKPFSCSECGRRFGRKSHLNEHMIIHTGQKPFGCSECGQRFGQKITLNTHMITHTGQKQFGCSECGRRFGRKSHLNEHMIIHTGQKPFGCSECGRRFGLKSYLNRHMRIHTTSLSASGSRLSCASTQLDNPPDHQITDPGPQQQQPQTAKRNWPNRNIVNWSIEEKKKILHCVAYSRYKKSGREKKAVFEERIQEVNLPAEEKEDTTAAKLQPIASQIPKYLTAEKIESIKEEAQEKAMNDQQSLEEGKQVE